MQNRLTIETLKQSSIKIDAKVKYCYDLSKKSYIDANEYSTTNEKCIVQTLAKTLAPYIVESTKNSYCNKKEYYYHFETDAFVTPSFFKDENTHVTTITYTNAAQKIRVTQGRVKNPKLETHKMPSIYFRKNTDGKKKVCISSSCRNIRRI